MNWCKGQNGQKSKTIESQHLLGSGLACLFKNRLTLMQMTHDLASLGPWAVLSSRELINTTAVFQQGCKTNSGPF